MKAVEDSPEEKQVGLTDYQVQCKTMFFALIKCALLYYKEFWPAEHQLFIDDIDHVMKNGNRQERRDVEKNASEKIRTNENMYLNFRKKIEDYLKGFDQSLKLVEGADKEFAAYSGFIHETLRRCFVVKDKQDFVVMIDMFLEGLFKEPFEEMKKLKLEALNLSEEDIEESNGKGTENEATQSDPGEDRKEDLQSSSTDEQSPGGDDPPGPEEDKQGEQDSPADE